MVQNYNAEGVSDENNHYSNIMELLLNHYDGEKTLKDKGFV